MLRFEELAHEQTPLGELTLRRRHEPAVGVDVFEVKLGDEFLMSSLFTVAEEALSDLGLAAVPAGRDGLDIVVGGLGPRLHRSGRPARRARRDDDGRGCPARRHRLARAATPPGVGGARRRPPHAPGAGRLLRPRARGPRSEGVLPVPLDAILLDVDHSPTFTLDPSHADLYTVEGLRRLAAHLRPGGVFALWSDDPPEESFLEALRTVFARVEGHTVAFDNPITGGTSRNGVYVAVLAG